MSIYSGFSTRALEFTYDSLIYDLIYVLIKRIHKFYHHQPANQIKFAKVIKEIFHKLQLLQKSKYLQPKYSVLMSNLFECFKAQKITDKTKSHEQRQTFWVLRHTQQEKPIGNQDSNASMKRSLYKKTEQPQTIKIKSFNKNNPEILSYQSKCNFEQNLKKSRKNSKKQQFLSRKHIIPQNGLHRSKLPKNNLWKQQENTFQMTRTPKYTKIKQQRTKSVISILPKTKNQSLHEQYFHFNSHREAEKYRKRKQKFNSSSKQSSRFS